MSPRLKVGIGATICVAIPFVERAERIFGNARTPLTHGNFVVFLDHVDDLVPLPQLEREPNGLRNRRLSLAREFTDNHGCTSKDDPYYVASILRFASIAPEMAYGYPVRLPTLYPLSNLTLYLKAI